MSERGAFRGGRGGARGGDRGGRGGGRGGAQSGGAAAQTERPKKENILDLSKYMDKQINVKFSGGREGMHCARTWDEKLEIHGLRACCNVYNVEADTC
jgi:U6 snRNA-associated Sm-like protein LSm7